MLKLHKKIHAKGGSSFKSGLYLAAYGIIRSSIANPIDEEYIKNVSKIIKSSGKYEDKYISICKLDNGYLVCHLQ